MISREQLENVVQKRKVTELHHWFEEHFIKSSQENYMNKCPFLIVEGPTGCGKTTTLKCVAKELKLTVQEYSETTDTTAINYDITNSCHDDAANEERAHTIDKRRAAKFERFVIEHLRFTTLYPVSDEPTLASADSEFESDDDFPSTLQSRAPPAPKSSGVIIHIEAPLSFSRSQRVLAQTLFRLVKIVKELSRTIKRRIAIVFENLECEKEALSLPTKLKHSLGIQTIKFNPIIKTNMKKFIETMLRKHPNITVDREAIEVLINDSNGDIRACINTFELLCNNLGNHSVVCSKTDISKLHISELSQVNKRQRLNPQRLKFSHNLLRDVTKSLRFFHVLGKIFYQKRLYPDRYQKPAQKIRTIDRPFRLENSTEYLLTRLDVSSKNLMTWLHQHYIQFCHTNNIDKAALLLEHLSDVDTISIDATQSSQYYEMQNALDQMQSHLAIESTVFSLYEDQSTTVKSSHKKTNIDGRQYLIKSSVESLTNGSGELYSFSKPDSLSVQKLIDDYRMILAHCTGQMMRSEIRCTDPTKVITDYMCYINYLSKNWSAITRQNELNGHSDSAPLVIKDEDLTNLLSLLESTSSDEAQLVGQKCDQNYEDLHESLMDIVQDIEQRSKAQVTSFLD